MARFAWVGVGVLLVAAAVGAYVLNSGAPPIPIGGCPALLSFAPDDSDVVGYADFTSLRSALTKQQADALTRSPGAAALNRFVSATNFHVERDLDHILFVASTTSNSGGLVLDGRFDQAKLADFFTKSGAGVHHYEAGDVYLFASHAPGSSLAVAFLDPHRLALTVGKDPETQVLVLADAARHSDTGSHEQLCARTSRVSGAPVFVLGGVPRTSSIPRGLAPQADSGVTDLLSGLQGWEVGFWADGDSVRLALEGDYDGRLDALKARFALQTALETARKQMASAGVAWNSSERAALDTFSKKLAITLDGHYLRLGTSLNRSDMLALATMATGGPNVASVGRR